MDILLLFTQLLVTAYISAFLGKRGLVRLGGFVHTSNIKLLTQGAIGSSAGVLVFLPAIVTDQSNILLEYACIQFLSLLVISAHIDRTTSWVPIEIIFPICGLSMIVSFGCMQSENKQLALYLVFGLGYYGLCLLIWKLQKTLNYCVFPPADIALLLMPMILFGVNFVSGLFYMLITCILGIIAYCSLIHSGSKLSIKILLQKNPMQDTSIATRLQYLGIACPIIVIFLVGQSLIYIANNGIE